MCQPKRRFNKRQQFEAAATATRLYPADSIRLRSLKASRNLNVSRYIRDAVHECLARDFGPHLDGGVV